MIVYNHLCIGILVVSIFALGVIACGSTVSDSGGSISSYGTGAAASTGGTASGGGNAASGGGGDGTAGTGGSTTGASGGSSGGGTAGTGGNGGAGGGSGGDGGAPETPLYVVSIDHWATPSVLRKIDVTTGIGKVVCALPSGVGGVDDVNYHSTTFSREGTLFASNANTGWIDKIDPCNCAVEHIGPTGFGSVPGITANKNNGLFGIDTTNNYLLDINPMTGAGTWIADLAVDFVNSGATWSDDANDGQGGIYAINSGDQSLHTIDPKNGSLLASVAITGVEFDSVGIEMHPANGKIYACTNDKILYSIDLDGAAHPIGPGMGHTKTCNNLAAPWTKIACLDSF